MQTNVQSGLRPPITLVDSEAEILADLALAAKDNSSLGAELLLEEIDRANTVGRAELPSDLVTMMSRVVFVDEATGGEHSVQLVYPQDADMEQDRLSILTPIGAALIGMRRGSSIDWPNRRGAYRRLKIVDVVQPERTS